MSKEQSIKERDRVHELEQTLNAVRQVHLASLPTPLARLSRLEQQWGHSGLYIKRDDMTGLGPGGNKLRSLEFLLGEAVEEKADVILASGPLQSNLCTLAAAACAKAGLQCILVHNGDEPRHMEGNVLLNRLLGAQSHYLGPVTAEERSAYVEKLARELSGGHRPYIVRNGATSGRGCLGYVKAVPELVRQTREMGLENLTLFAPGGNGGVASGLIYGNALCGFPFHIVIISVENDRETLTADIRRTIKEAEGILNLPFPGALEESCVIDDSYRGGGWGEDTDQSSQIITQFAQAEGILIENIYNSKVLVGMRDYVCSGKTDGPACFLHTGGFGSLFAQY